MTSSSSYLIKASCTVLPCCPPPLCHHQLCEALIADSLVQWAFFRSTIAPARSAALYILNIPLQKTDKCCISLSSAVLAEREEEMPIAGHPVREEGEGGSREPDHHPEVPEC